VVIGAVLALAGLGMAVAGAVLLTVDQTQRDDAGFLGLGSRTYSTGGYAVTSDRIQLDDPGAGWFSYEDTIGEVRISAESTAPDTPVFVGIAPAGAAATYLRDVARLAVGDPAVSGWPGDDGLPGDAVNRSGGPPAQPPTEVDVWVTATSGPGEQVVRWEPEPGLWTIVAMNADGSRGVDVRTQLAASLPALTWVAGWLIGIGTLMLLIAVVLLAVPISRAGRQ
jgi:hypothetical protein